MFIEDYEMKTTFWRDFSIADTFGKDAIKDTYNRAFKAWHDNTEYITELVLVLNWKCWQHYDLDHTDTSKLYADLFYECQRWCYSNLKGEDLEYFYRTTD